MKILNWKIGVGLLATAITLPVMMWTRGYPWTLALIVAAAVGLLAYTTGSTLERLRASPHGSTSRPPGKEQDGSHQE